MAHELIMTVGLPGSGKTTWMMEKVKKDAGKYVNINRDDLRMTLFGLKDYNEYKFSKEREKMVTEAQYALAAAALRMNKSIIISDTNLNPEVRDKWKRWAEENKYKFLCKNFLDLTLEELVRRDASRARSVGYYVIKDMWNKYIDQMELPKLEPATRDLSLKKAIIIDIDGTIADYSGIRGPFDWNKVSLDRPHDDIIDLLAGVIVTKDYVPLFVSGRDGVCYDDTYGWIIKNFYKRSKSFKDIELFMRAPGDMRKDYVVKYELYNRHIRGVYNVEYVFDDRDQVVNMWRDLGLRCLQVAPGDF